MTVKSLRRLLILFFAIIAIFFLITPFLISYETVYGLNGSPGIIDYFYIWKTLNPLSEVVYSVGDILCHQTYDRSFILNGNQMAICVRDFSALIGLIIGLTLVEKYKMKTKSIIFFFVISFTLLILDVLIQSVMGLNIEFTRIITGLLAGISVGLLINYGIDNMIS